MFYSEAKTNNQRGVYTHTGVIYKLFLIWLYRQILKVVIEFKALIYNYSHLDQLGYQDSLWYHLLGKIYIQNWCRECIDVTDLLWMQFTIKHATYLQQNETSIITFHLGQAQMSWYSKYAKSYVHFRSNRHQVSTFVRHYDSINGGVIRMDEPTSQLIQ